MPVRPSAMVKGLPADVDRALGIALAKDPADRYASAGAFAEALRDATAGRLQRRLRVRAEGLLAQLPWRSG